AAEGDPFLLDQQFGSFRWSRQRRRFGRCRVGPSQATESVYPHEGRSTDRRPWLAPFVAAEDYTTPAGRAADRPIRRRYDRGGGASGTGLLFSPTECYHLRNRSARRTSGDRFAVRTSAGRDRTSLADRRDRHDGRRR